jgi:hypothetical protein
VPIASVTASDFQAPNVPENTQDGDLNTRWSAEGEGQWIRYELGTQQAISAVHVAWHQGDRRTSEFTIQVSTDAVNWTDVFSGRSLGTTLGIQHYTFSGIVAKFVRIIGYGNTENRWNSITEVEIYSVDTTSNNFPPNPLAAAINTVANTLGTSLVDPNDPDIGQTHTFAISTAPANGTATVDADGLVTYTPTSGFIGDDSIMVAVTDNGTPARSGAVVIAVTVTGAEGNIAAVIIAIQVVPIAQPEIIEDIEVVLRNTPPPQGDTGGPNVTASPLSGAIRGGTSQLQVTADIPFTVFIVIVPGFDGFWEVRLPAPVIAIDIRLTLAQFIPDTFVCSYQGGDGNGNFGNRDSQEVEVIQVGTGDIQVSLSWDTLTDVDLSVEDPNGVVIFFGNREPITSNGRLDLDSNPDCTIDGINNENITWPTGTAVVGTYIVSVNLYAACSNLGANYTVTINVTGQPSQTINGSLVPPDVGANAVVATFEVP